MSPFGPLTTMFAILGLAASSDAAPATPAQTDEVVSLKQITIRVPAEEPKAEQKVRVDSFRLATRGIGSCAEVDAIARKLGGTVFHRPQTPLRSLPPAVRLLLATAGPDRATIPYGKAPNVHVLIQCGASRKIPSRVGPSA